MSLTKKTPFYRITRQRWRRKSLFTAIKKVCHPAVFLFKEEEKGTDPRWVQCQAYCRLRSSAYVVIADRSANTRLSLPCIRGAVSLSRVEKKQHIFQSHQLFGCKDPQNTQRRNPSAGNAALAFVIDPLTLVLSPLRGQRQPTSCLSIADCRNPCNLTVLLGCTSLFCMRGRFAPIPSIPLRRPCKIMTCTPFCSLALQLNPLAGSRRTRRGQRGPQHEFAFQIRVRAACL
jgi:hypothetical protein